MEPIGSEHGDDPAAAWPDRLRELGSIWRSGRTADESTRAFGEIWVLLRLALRKYVRLQSKGGRPVSPDDVSDIASEKASELLRRLDIHEWNPADSTAAQLCGFLATIARNGVVDLHRLKRREVSAPDGFDVPSSSGAWGGHDATGDSPASAVDGATYARAILACAAALSQRARRAWCLRIFYELESSDIAHDPGVATTPAGVDAMLARCREQMRLCLEGKGLPIGPLPPGTFVRLWDMTRRNARFFTAPPEGAGR